MGVDDHLRGRALAVFMAPHDFYYLIVEPSLRQTPISILLPEDLSAVLFCPC